MSTLSFPRKRLHKFFIAGVTLLVFGRVIGADLNVTGNITATGTIDTDGNSVSFGTQSATNTTVPGVVFTYTDNSIPTTGGIDSFKSLVNRSAASWLWSNGPSGGPFVNAMRLDNAHQLLLFRSDGTTAGLTFTPQTGLIKLGTNASATLTANDTTGVITAAGGVTVAGALTASSGITNTNGTFTGGATGLNLGAGGTNQNITLTPTGTGVVQIRNTGTPSILSTLLTDNSGTFVLNGWNNVALQTGSNTRLFAQGSTGNVGIGTQIPGTRLTVAGGDLQVESGQGRFKGWYNTGSGLGAEIGVSSGVGYLLTYDRTAGVYGTTMVSSGATYVNVNSNGNVGVGTTIPADKLHVAGNVLVDGSKAFIARYNTGDSYRGHFAWDHLQFGNNGANYIVAGNTAGGGSLGFVVNNTNDLTGLYADTNKNGVVAMTLASSGNVGIGTQAPTTKLQVVGGQLGNETVSVVTNYPSVATNGTNYTRNLGFYSYNLPIAAGVTDSGYRIGLDIENFVNDASFLGALNLQYGLLARVGSYSAGTGTIQNSYGVYIDNLDGPATVGNKYGLYQSNATAKNFFAGSVGIGTSPSSAKLDVGGTLHLTDGSFLHNSVHGDYEMQQLLAANNGGGTGDAALYSWVSEPGVTWTGAGIARNMRNSGTGFPRVNTGLSGQMIRFDEGAGIWFTTETATGTRYNPMYLSGNDMIVSGNVGIGTANVGSYKLSVLGQIHATAVVVETGWSDYVFDKDYRLAPLSEVEAHIKAEKHLPGIPSAAEVAEKGVSLGDMQSKLLAKVEELTLHLIAQEKRMSAQQDEIAALREQVSALKGAAR